MTFQKWNWNTIQPQLGLGRAIINVDTVFCFQLQARILFLISFIAPYESQSSSDYKCESVSSECNRSVIIQPKFIKLTCTAAKPVFNREGDFSFGFGAIFQIALSVSLCLSGCYAAAATRAGQAALPAATEQRGMIPRGSQPSPAQPSSAQLKIRSVIILSPAR